MKDMGVEGSGRRRDRAFMAVAPLDIGAGFCLGIRIRWIRRPPVESKLPRDRPGLQRHNRRISIFCYFRANRPILPRFDPSVRDTGRLARSRRLASWAGPSLCNNESAGKRRGRRDRSAGEGRPEDVQACLPASRPACQPSGTAAHEKHSAAEKIHLRPSYAGRERHWTRPGQERRKRGFQTSCQVLQQKNLTKNRHWAIISTL